MTVRIDSQTRARPMPDGGPAGGSGRTDEATILVADDEDAVRSIMVRVLRRHGYRVLEASGWETALGIVEEGGSTIDLLITDVVMPDRRGPELARRVRALHPGIRVLFISGYQPDEVAEAEDGTVGRFLQKPFTPTELVRAVSAALAPTGSEPPTGPLRVPPETDPR